MNNLREHSMLARTIALPHENKPMRYPGFPAMEKTSVLALTASQTASVPATGVVRFALLRQPTFPAWVEQLSPGMQAAFWSVPTSPGGTGTLLNQTFLQVDSFRSNFAISATSTRMGCAGPVGTIPNPVMGIIDNEANPYFYLPDGTATIVAALPNPTTNYFTSGVNESTLQLERYLGPSKSESYETYATIAQDANHVIYVLNFPAGSWIRMVNLQIDGFLSTTLSVEMQVGLFVNYCTTIGVSQVAGVMPLVTYTAGTTARLLPIPIGRSEFAETTMPWAATRVTAVSLLATNVTNIQNKGGTVLACRVNPKISNVWTFTESDVNAVHPSERAYMALETGFYSYCPPSGDMTNFGRYIYSFAVSSTSAGAVVGTDWPVVRLDNDAMAHIAYFRSAGSVETMAVTVDLHLEFRNTLALFQVGMSKLTLESLHQAQLDLVSKGYFFENFSHTKILRALTAGVKSVGRHALAVARVVDPRADMAYRGGKWALEKTGWIAAKPGPSLPKTTTLANSGWTKRSNTGVKRRKPIRVVVTRKAKPAAPPKRSGLQMYLDSRK